MLPTLRKYSDCACSNGPRSAGQAAVVGLALTALLLPLVPAAAQRNTIIVKGGGGTITKSKVANPNVTVLTAHNNNQRTGLNTLETSFVTALGSTNLSPQTFGKIWSRPGNEATSPAA